MDVPEPAKLHGKGKGPDNLEPPQRKCPMPDCRKTREYRDRDLEQHM